MWIVSAHKNLSVAFFFDASYTDSGFCDVRDAETVMMTYDLIALGSRRARMSTGRMINATANMDWLLRQAQMPFTFLKYHPMSARLPPVEEVVFCIA